ncbi:MAG: PilW family protein, partial [Candidatus Hydrogenedens sp.]
MLQNNNKKQVELLYTSDTKYRTGMTLIELVVAMAILSIILTGLVTMFVSAIESTHQGYMVKESYGNARSAMEILSRDLERACTLANRGEKVQFYGTPTALTFVTMLDNGQVGRVT